MQTQLAATNRWWRAPDWTDQDRQLNAAAAAPFSYRAGCLQNLQPGGLYLLRGPRRSGKSTEMKQAILDLLRSGVPPRNIVHAAVDGWRASDVRALVTSAAETFLHGTTGTRYWFLDEISSVTGDWPNTIKNLRDNDPVFAEDTVVLTGSSAARLHEVRKAFAGRRGEVVDADRTLLPMGFTEFVAAAGLKLPPTGVVEVARLREPATREHVTALLPYLSDLVNLWESYLRVGGFPQAVAAWHRTGDVGAPLVDALWDVVYGDAIAGARFSAPQTLTLLARLSANLCSPLAVADLARDLDVTPATVRERLTDLAENFLAWPCHQAQGLAAKLSAQSKWYFTDPLLARLAALREFGNEPDHTQLSQQQIGMALLRNLNAAAGGGVADHDAVLYYRSRTRAEIDFVGRRMGGIAVESKYADATTGRDAQTIAASPWRGVIASRSVTSYREPCDVLPAPLVALLLGADPPPGSRPARGR